MDCVLLMPCSMPEQYIRAKKMLALVSTEYFLLASAFKGRLLGTTYQTTIFGIDHFKDQAERFEIR